MKKTTVISTLNKLPKEFLLDELLERLIVIEKIDEGLRDVSEGKTISHADLKKDVKKWLK